MSSKSTGPRVNSQIWAKEVMVVDESGPIGIMPLEKANSLAKERGLDLIEVSPKATPVVAKIMDFGKWKYEAKKKEKERRSSQTTQEVKELQLRPRTDKHDLDVKILKALEFLKDGDKVKFSLKYQGRELQHVQIGMEQLKYIENSLKGKGTKEFLSRLEDKQVFIMFAPVK